ncbi:hypothetical protein WJ69_17715 [Burkholderia ubonensis]|nr:hypothetical protein WJ69_17715 [Burkholderia ubonensis]
MDAHGIDDNRKELSKLSSHVDKVLIKKDARGTPVLDHGAYVSKAGEPYGDFKWVNPKGLIKYQAKEVATIKFDSPGDLDRLGKVYSNTPLPDFLVQILNSEACGDTELYKNNPNLAEFLPPVDKRQHGFLIRPNSPYSSKSVLDIYVKSPQLLRNSKQGITLCTYAIHPDIKSSFLENHSRDFMSGSQKVDRSTPQYEIDRKTNIKSLTSILDLGHEHLPQLKDLKERTLQHLQRVYGTDDNDAIRMFFHFPVAEKTATLHLHTWVNKGDHPLNEPRSFDLDVIINHLESKKEMSELVLNRNNGTYYLPTSDSIKDIRGIPFVGIKSNPLLLSL